MAETIEELDPGLAAAELIVSDVAGDGGEPGTDGFGFAERVEATESGEEDFLDEVFGLVIADVGEEDAVDHAGVALVKMTESRRVAGLSGAGPGGFGRFGHGEQGGWHRV